MRAISSGLKLTSYSIVIAGMALSTSAYANEDIDPTDYTTSEVVIQQGGMVNIPPLDVASVAELVNQDSVVSKAYRYGIYYSLAGQDQKGNYLDVDMWPAEAQADPANWRGLTPNNCGVVRMVRNGNQGPRLQWEVNFTAPNQSIEPAIAVAGFELRMLRNLPAELADDVTLEMIDHHGQTIWKMSGHQFSVADDIVGHDGTIFPAPTYVHTALVPIKPYDPMRRYKWRMSGPPSDRFTDHLEHHCAITGMSTCFRGPEMMDLIDHAGLYEPHVTPYYVRSGSCNIDVVCDEAGGYDIRSWDAEISCVAVISTGGSTFCTGFSVNNVNEDQTPFFMTAYHCGISSSNAGSLVAYWNYENSVCRTPGSPESGGADDGQLNQFSTGATYLAGGSASDFVLVQFSNPHDEAHEVSYCGWNADPDPATYQVGIHHPNTDAKRISFDDDEGAFSAYLDYDGTTGDHVRVTAWEYGTTEPGSSGSPIFNQNHQVTGQLHGGYASCSSITGDWYGAFATSYYATSGGASLQQWLDPFGVITSIDTLGGGGMSVQGPAATLWIGPEGGPFTNEATGGGNSEYVVKNNFDVAIDYSINFDQPIALKINGSTTGLSGTLNAGSSLNVGVTVDDSADDLDPGFQTANLVFEDTTNNTQFAREHTIEIGQTNFVVDPEYGFEAGGPVGGPFRATQTYLLTSTRPTDIEIEISSSESWISVNGTTENFNVTLTESEPTFAVTVGFNRAANGLPAGIVNGTVRFDNVDGDQGDTNIDVTLDVGRYSYAAVDVPQDILDNTILYSYIDVGDFYCIGDVDVEMDITHTWAGDLEVILTSPAGTSVYLHNRTGGDSDNVQTTYGDGTSDPDGPGALSDFIGESSAGVWTLEVGDYAGADQGTLNAWKLKIASSGDDCPPSAADVGSGGDLDEDQTIVLQGTPGTGGALDYVIDSLPAGGVLRDSGSAITAVPHTLGSDTVVYDPANNFSGPDSFTYYVVENSTNSNTAVVNIQVGVPPVLLVDDDDNNPDVRSYYTNTLDAMGVTYDVFDTVNSDNEPPANVLGQYDLIIWFTGAEFGCCAGPGTDGETALGTYLNAGGCLLVSSQDWLWDKGGSGADTLTPLMTDYMGMSSGTSDVGQTTMSGANDTFSGLSYTLDIPYTNYTDIISTSSGALAFNGDSGDGGIENYGDTYGAWYLGFGIEAIPTVTERADLLNAVFALCADDPEPEDCPGDFDSSGAIDTGDFSSFLVAFGNDCTGCDEDMDGSGTVDTGDFSLFLVVFGTSCD